MIVIGGIIADFFYCSLRISTKSINTHSEKKVLKIIKVKLSETKVHCFLSKTNSYLWLMKKSVILYNNLVSFFLSFMQKFILTMTYKVMSLWIKAVRMVQLLMENRFFR